MEESRGHAFICERWLLICGSRLQVEIANRVDVVLIVIELMRRGFAPIPSVLSFIAVRQTSRLHHTGSEIDCRGPRAPFGVASAPTSRGPRSRYWRLKSRRLQIRLSTQK